MKPTNREEFKQYCLRKLGKSVIEINVSDEQVDDRIDEALSYYKDFHYDGSEKLYLKHTITTQDFTNRYVTLPNSLVGIIGIFPLNGSLTAGGMFSASYQFVLNHVHEFTNYDLVNYYMSMQHLSFMQEILSGSQSVRYNRHTDKLYIDTDWNSRLPVGSIIIVECYQGVDESVNSDVWSDRWLQNYATAKIRHQFGVNITKFSGMNLPGNIQFNGELILQQAIDEIQKLEDEAINTYSPILMNMIG